MKSQELVSIIIPARNEEETIGMVLDDLDKVIKQNSEYAFEVILVDNNSNDRTTIVAQRSWVQIISEKKKGKGYALVAGFNQAKGNIIVMLDADYSHMPEDIPLFLKKIEEGYGLVVGSRTTGGSEEYTVIRSFGNSLLTAAFTMVFSITLSDVLNGFKAFRKEVVKNYKYHSDDFQIEIELVANALRAGYKIGEFPSHERIRGGGKMKSMALIHGPKFLSRILIEGLKFRLGK